MLIPQRRQCEANQRQGGRVVSLAELRRHLSDPSSIDGGHRQRLLELARRLARVQALGDEYARVQVSQYVESALASSAIA